MNNHINRRDFLYLGLIGSAALYAHNLWALKVQKKEIDEVIISILRKYFKHYKLNEENLRGFAKNFSEPLPHNPNKKTGQYLIENYFQGFSGPRKGLEFQQYISHQFLLGSNYFSPQFDPKEELLFLGEIDLNEL